VRFSRL
jgi:hypothetical protein